MSFPVGWNRKCALVIQHSQVTANQTIAVAITNASGCLPTEMVTASGPNAAQSDGGDIRFSSDSAGSTRLACEVVLWSQNATPSLAKAEIWVPVTVSTSVDTTIYVWYNAGGGQTQPAANAAFGSQAVWDSNYKGGVVHFPPGSGTLTLTDSTGTNTFSNSGMTAGAGIVDGCGASNGLTQEADLGLLGSMFDGANTIITIEYWLYASTTVTAVNKNVPLGTDSISLSGSFRCILGTDSATTNLIQLAVNTSGSFGNNYKELRSTATTLAISTWYHVVMIMDMVTLSNSLVYMNGASVAKSTSTGGSPGSVLPSLGSHAFFGRFQGGGVRWDGGIDEYRMSNIARSSTYISTTYNNQNAPGSFIIAGTPGPTTTGGFFRVDNPLSGLGGGGPFFTDPLN